jgi:hypothetical protein
MADHIDFDRNGNGAGNGIMQNIEAQYHKEARKREIERMKREFQDLKARNFKKKNERAAALALQLKKQ